MEKYIINENYHGYNKISINDIDKTNESNNIFVVIIDKTCDENTAQYYNFINNALKNINRVIVISVQDQNKTFRPIASMMICFKAYDIYEITDKDNLSAQYLLKLEDREPDFSEVQTYIGGDLTSYSDMNMILFGIESLIEEGNTDALKKFIEEHMISIENLTTSLNNMKKICDMFNSNELINQINTLKEQEEKLNKTIEDKDENLSSIKYDRDKYKVESETLKRENNKLKEKTQNLQEQAKSGGNTIKTYKTVNTQLLRGTKTKIILYFKEISYVRYMNTLTNVLLEFIKRHGLKTKLMIYDTNSEMSRVYEPLRVIRGNEYVADKSLIIHKVESFVVAEPSQMIIEDMLTSDMQFDVLIIYDRMHTLTDIVEGNLVTKFYVMNSRKDYEALKDVLKITDTSFIITNSQNSLNISKDWKTVGPRDFLDIPTIDDFKKRAINSDSFVFSKYVKQASANSKKAIIQTIIEKSKINTLYNE